MSNFYIELDQDDLNKVLAKFDGLKKAPNHLRNAINRTATQAMRMIKTGSRKGYTIKTKRFNQAVSLHRATSAKLNAFINSADRPPTLKNFKISRSKAGVKADITKTGLKKLILATGGAAFIPSGGKLEGFVAQRKSKNRFPLRVLYGPSVPKMIEKIYQGERGGQGDMEEVIRKHLHDEIQKELAKIM